jgi:hypothetical protein
MIYAKYDKTTGSVLGHYAPDIHPALFDASGNPLSDDMVALTEDQHQASIIGGIRIVSGVPTPYIYQPSIEELRQVKLIWVSQQVAENITDGFTSAAAGVPATYDSQEVDQDNIKTLYIASQNPSFGTVQVRAVVAGQNTKSILTHTPAQMQTLVSDMARHVSTCKAHGWELQAAVANATSASDLDALAWPSEE